MKYLALTRMRLFLWASCAVLLIASCMLPAQADTPVSPSTQPAASPPGPVASPSPAEVGTINTNRPTQGTNTGVVGPGVFQLETGAQLTTYKRGTSPDLFQFVAQFRAGLGKNTEINLTNPVYNSQGGFHGVGDTNVAFKWQFAQAQMKDGTAVFALVPNATFRTGATPFRNPGTIGQLIVSADLPVGKSGQNLTLCVAGSTLVDASNNKRFGQLFGAAYYTFPVSSTVSGFFELSGTGPDQSVGGAFNPAADFGMAFLVGNLKDTQIDFDVLKGLGTRGVNWSFTIGLSQRFR